MHAEHNVIKRFNARVCPEPNSGCFLWMGSVTHRGYGAFSYGKQMGAHVFAYLWHKGEIPDGHVVHHRCNVPSCVNPDHLEAVTPSVNVREGRKLMFAKRGPVHSEDVKSFRDIIALFPSQEAFATEVDVNFYSVVGWQRRNMIPWKHWMRVEKACRNRGFDFVTIDLLLSMVRPRKRAA